MSASLVGSEMCIRDRSCFEQFPALPLRGWGALPLPRIPPKSASGARGGCLLYTSDAADDM
eukprot:2748921-Alexandrium_andersonii.AAC.1